MLINMDIADELSAKYLLKHDTIYIIAGLCDTYAKLDLACYLAARFANPSMIIYKLKNNDF